MLGGLLVSVILVFVVIYGGLMVYDPKLWVAVQNRVNHFTSMGNVSYQLSDKIYESRFQRVVTRIAGVLMVVFVGRILVLVVQSLFRSVFGGGAGQ